MSSNCEYPNISDREESILTGLLLGDGYINEQKKGVNRLVVTSTSKEFLTHLSNEAIPWLFKSPYLYQTAEKAAKNMDKSGPSKTVNVENYNDAYRSHTPAHPHFNNLREWYRSGSKKFPEKLKLDPDMIRYWYAGDGSLASYNKNAFAEISSKNEELEWLSSLFSELGFDVTTSVHKVRIPTSQTQDFLDMIGPPVPGYEYKWDR